MMCYFLYYLEHFVIELVRDSSFQQWQGSHEYYFFFFREATSCMHDGYKLSIAFFLPRVCTHEVTEFVFFVRWGETIFDY
jgi:hypothetical protein